MGTYDVLVGVNLLREGLDLPEVSLVIILDADKEGFLRNERALIQTMGRAARNESGRVLLYADKITGAMHRAIHETQRRRNLQIAYNKAHNISPKTVQKSKKQILEQTRVADVSAAERSRKLPQKTTDPILSTMGKQDLQRLHESTYKEMQKAAAAQDFMRAAQLRDEWQALAGILEQKA